MIIEFLANNANNQEGQPLGILKGLGPLGLEDIPTITKELVFERFNDIISVIIGVMTVAAGIWFLFLAIIAGYQWMTSGGDKAGVTAAREKLTYAVIGLVVVVAAFALISLIGTLMGIEFLQPGKIILERFPITGGGE